ncbi:MAG: MoaD/ThiS family protein [Deltaproteobacteria bacterium]|nr:MoaD/ThiS family protein [Deltaproteobacteria bacterium]
MKINVELKGRFKDVLKLPDPCPLELQDDINVRDLLYRLCRDTGCSEDTFFNKDLRLKPNVAVTKNGRFIIHLKWLDTPLDEGDIVTIFTLHCGG